MTEERANYNIDYTDAEEDMTVEDLLKAIIQEMITDPETPAWTHPVLNATAEEDHTYRLSHLREDVRLLIRILEGRTGDAIALWIGEDIIPGWMRYALATYLAAEGRFARGRVVADAETVEEILTIRCGYE